MADFLSASQAAYFMEKAMGAYEHDMYGAHVGFVGAHLRSTEMI